MNQSTLDFFSQKLAVVQALAQTSRTLAKSSECERDLYLDEITYICSVTFPVWSCTPWPNVATYLSGTPN